MAVKKTTQKESSSWVGEVEKYSRKIWLAGLGVYSKVSSDGGKYFETLVKDGEKAEKLTKTSVGKKVDAAKATAGSAKSSISDTWGKLEETFDKRLNSAISRLGVPSKAELKTLHSKVDTLTRQLEKLTGAKATPVKAAAAKPAAKTAAAKPAAKSAAKPAAKAPAKAAAKPAAKTAAAKPASKPAAKPVAAKPAAKPAAVKTAAKPAAKTAAKPAAKTAAAKPAAKPAADKPAAKPAAKPTAARKPAAAKTPAAAKPASSAANSVSAPAATPTATPVTPTPSSQS
ncbi:phasin family protein [Pseudomonas poae]|uniref:phasin family protein n=1 Tax=Pseudomonas poae TaxID=200451 RepID=UPI0034D48D14